MLGSLEEVVVRPTSAILRYRAGTDPAQVCHGAHGSRLILPSISLWLGTAMQSAHRQNAAGSSFNAKARYNKCHSLSQEKRDPTYFMDLDFHNIGIGIVRHNVVAESCKAERQINSGNEIDVDRAAIQSDMPVLGRFLVTKKDPDIASFKTPGLRNVLITAPYFHDGSQATLWDVVDHYNKGDGIKDPWLDEDMQTLELTEPEIDDLVEFTAALTSSQYQQQGIKELERQRAISRRSRPQRDAVRAFGPKPVPPKPFRICSAP